MMASQSELGLLPKKRVTTYGKGGKRTATTAGISAVKGESSKTTSRSTASPPSSSPEVEAPRRAAAGTSQNKPKTASRGLNRSGRPTDSATSSSQPLPADVYEMEMNSQENTASRKRKLGRSQSDLGGSKSASLLRTPESSGSRSPVNDELDDVYAFNSPPRKKSRTPPMPAATKVEKIVRPVKPLPKKPPVPKTQPAPAAAKSYDVYDFDAPSAPKPKSRPATSTLGGVNTTTTAVKTKPVSTLRTAPVQDVEMEEDNHVRISSSAKALSKPTILAGSAAPPVRKQPPQQIPLRLSKEMSGRPAGILKKRTSPAPTRPITQPKTVQQTRPLVPTAPAAQTNRSSQIKPITTAKPIPNARPTKQRKAIVALDSLFEDDDDEPASVPKPVTRKRTGRLIDALADQEDPESSGEEMDEDSQPTEEPLFPNPASSFSEIPAPSPAKQKVLRIASSAKKPGPKFTYGGQKTTIVEEDLTMEDAGVGGAGDASSKAPLFDFARLANIQETSTFLFVDEDEDLGHSGAVRSIHELRQAGANSRFADEMSDIMDRIASPSGKPNSLRRGALYELAEKLQEKDFRRMFRNHGGGASLFERLGDETDIIAGYTILCILVTLLGTSQSAHLVQQVVSQGFGDLVFRFLTETEDIKSIARDRKSNVSKNGQNTLIAIKAALLKLDIWEAAAPTALSPRTVALKSLDLIIRQSPELVADETIFSRDITNLLFSILTPQNSEDEDHWDFPAQPASNDFYLALYLLESVSMTAMQSQLRLAWTDEYMPTVADVLETCLRRPAEKFADLENLVLRLVLNLTNNNPAASRMCVDRGLIHGLANAACGAFSAESSAIKSNAFSIKTHESLVFLLGVFINLCENYPDAGANIAAMGDNETSPLTRLIRLFLDYHSTTGDADSLEKTGLNVAFGYLSIVLGYLCQNSDARDRFETVHTRRTLEPLISAINDFIGVHEKAVKDIEGDQEGGAVERLRGLVQQLEHPRRR